jgi:hypothetical protein
MAFKAINNFIRLNRLMPTLLVFSAYPHITNLDALLLIVIQYTTVVKKAIAKICKLYAK